MSRSGSLTGRGSSFVARNMGGCWGEIGRGARIMIKLLEKDVVAAWQSQVQNGTVLTTEQGEPVEIVYPGRHNDGWGADFQDAVIATGGRLKKGDIEVHVRSSDWKLHRHHLDPAYNRVVLHVVWHDDEITTSLCDGSTVPVLALNANKLALVEGRSTALHPPAPPTPCAGGISGKTAEVLADFLDQAGDERFLAKATGFQTDLMQISASQSLYRGMMGALGYSRNKGPFLELAERLPLATLEAVASEATSDEECLVQLQVRLLGTAGLLPAQRGSTYRQDIPAHRYVKSIERLWSLYCDGREMSSNVWHLSCTRPYNSPLRRLVAMSYLVTRYRNEGLMSGLCSNCAGFFVSCRDWHRLEEGLIVTADGYWACHFDFGVDNQTASPTILGKGRASDIIVNVLLPFTYAWSKSDGRPELAIAVRDIYRQYPKLSDNALVRHMMSQLGIGRRIVNSARRQQGLLHIYQTLCTQGCCDRCCL
ncbi:MAG: DUF2851 family protein [Dehalococcoidales bacterium]|nr:MAG: DUF2851 family protein [Dehalococcoidales bacterium]